MTRARKGKEKEVKKEERGRSVRKKSKKEETQEQKLETLPTSWIEHEAFSLQERCSTTELNGLLRTFIFTIDPKTVKVLFAIMTHL
jgi:hypothetical protein